MEGFADGSGVGAGTARLTSGEGLGEGEIFGSWARAVVAAARLRTLRARARTIRAKGNTGVRACYSHPFCRARRAASMRFATPSLLIASDK